MADEATTDMLMQFESTSRGPITAECPLTISPNDALAKQTLLSSGLKAQKYFLVSQFAFGVELHDNEKGQGNGKAGAGLGGRGGGTGGGSAGGPRLGGSIGGTGFTGASFGGGAGGTRGGALARGGDHFDDFSPISLPGPGGSTGGSSGGKSANGGSGADGKKAGTKQGGSFARWRSATDDSWTEAGAYPSYINEFTFTRLIDMASPVLFDYCCRKESFPFVTFVKRKAAIAGTSLMAESLTYLRIDLANVLLTSIRWSDGDIIEESCGMKCQKMRIVYCQQNPDSTLVPAGQPVIWESPVISPASDS
jgi:type VI protein secretion system component Hcp